MPKQKPSRIKFNPKYWTPFPTKTLWDENGKLDMSIFDPKNRKETLARILG